MGRVLLDVDHLVFVSRVGYGHCARCGWVVAPLGGCVLDASRRARNFNPGSVRYVYFAVLIVYAVLGVIFLCLEKPTTLLFIGTLIMNFAFCFTCLHTLVVNTTLLPKSLRPGWFCRVALLISAVFFLMVATIATMTSLGWI